MTQPSRPQKNRDETALLVAIFLDLLGFGMLFADIQLRAESLTPAGWPKGLVIGSLLATTFVIQLVVSPIWGRRSDHMGRKAVVVICTALSGLAMVTYGLAGSLAVLVVSRVLSGFGAANVAVAQAFISDRYEGADRTAALGRIGAAVSLGLVVGPPIGGVLAVLGARQPFLHGLPGQFLLGILAGGCSLLGALILAVVLPNLPPRLDGDPEVVKPPKRSTFALLHDFPALRRLALVVGVAWLSLATLEGTFARLIERLFGYGQLQFGALLGYEALAGIAVQGLILGFVAKRLSEKPLVRSAFVAQGVGLALNPASALLASSIPPLATLFVASTLYAVGAGLANPTVNSICSRTVPSDRQGELFGLLQGTRSLGFVLGPLVGGVLFDWHPAAPYVLAGAVCVLAAALV